MAIIGRITEGGLIIRGLILGGSFSPLDLFADGELGAWYDISDLTTLFVDSGGTTPVTVNGDPVGLVADKSGNSNDASQAVSAARPTYNDTLHYSVTTDGVDDNMTADLANGAYSVFQQTPSGLIEYEIIVSGGAGWPFYADPIYNADGEIVELIATSGSPRSAEVRAYLASKHGLPADFSGVTSADSWFRARTDITALGVSGWDTSSVAGFYQFASSCSSLTTVTVNGGTGSPFSDSSCTNYTSAFTNTNLTQQSIDDILVAIEAANTSSGTFDQSGGSAPSATGEAAIDSLRGRSWTISVTGGY